MAKKNSMKVISVRKPVRKSIRKKKEGKTEPVGDSLLMKLGRKIDYQLGKYAFIVGVLTALIITIIDIGNRNLAILSQMWIFLVLLGLIIGLINITHTERHAFLLSVIALMVAGNLNFSVFTLWRIGSFIDVFILNLVMLFGPAALIVALESIYSLAKSR